MCSRVCNKAHTHTQRSVVTQLAPSGQPLQPHHFPSLGGMTDGGSREKGEKKEGGWPSIGRSPDVACLSGWLAGMCCTYSRRIERLLAKQGGCVYVS